ncbi:MAG: hypothetical protein K0S12_415 [Bacteroidetes bacterium]|jgi:PAS domain-containing protein|nr:hypothetical protein [Bacteroidota bacterium]
MHKLSFPDSTSFKDLPLDVLNKAQYGVYVTDLDWNYLFVNKFVAKNLGPEGEKLIGKNMWTTFPPLKNDATFKELKERTEKGIESSFTTISPLTGQKIHITGQVLKDCYLFTSSVLPKKEDVIEDLKRTLHKRKVA